MLDSSKFIKKLINNGFTHLCVVPCSFATNLINACINNSDEIKYLPCASEAVACSTAAGLKLSGKSPIVIVQSSGLTNMGSCITSLLKPYEITLPILVSWRTFKEGDSEIQHAHLSTNLPYLVEAYGYEHETLDQGDESKAVEQLKASSSENKIIFLKKDTFSDIDLHDSHKLDISRFPQRSEYLKELNKFYKNSDVVFIGTTGNTSREMYSFMEDTKNFYMAGNMGGALSLGLGSALAGNKSVVCGGDAEFVMHMGGLVTSGRYKDLRGYLLYIVFDNQSNKSTGGQRTYQEHINYNQLAKFSGFTIEEGTIEDLDHFKDALSTSENKKMHFIHVKCSFDQITERPPAKDLIKSKEEFS